MQLRARRRSSSYTRGVKRSSAWGWPDRHSVSSCVKLAGTCIVVLSTPEKSLVRGTGVSPKHTVWRRHEGISVLASLLPPGGASFDRPPRHIFLTKLIGEIVMKISLIALVAGCAVAISLFDLRHSC